MTSTLEDAKADHRGVAHDMSRLASRLVPGLSSLLLALFLAVILGLTLYWRPDRLMQAMAVVLFVLGLAGCVGLAVHLGRSWWGHTSPGKTTPAMGFVTAVLVLSAALVSLDRFAAAPTEPPPDAGAGPIAGQLVYRVYDGVDAQPFGSSWTPVDPRTFGPESYRVVAGLPDALNKGSKLIFGYLDDPSAVRTVRAALPVVAGANAHCSYPGGLIEYVIPDARAHVRGVRTVELDPRFGDKPAQACDASPN